MTLKLINDSLGNDMKHFNFCYDFGSVTIENLIFYLLYFIIEQDV